MEYLLENGYFDENYKIYSLKYGVKTYRKWKAQTVLSSLKMGLDYDI